MVLRYMLLKYLYSSSSCLRFFKDSFCGSFSDFSAVTFPEDNVQYSSGMCLFNKSFCSDWIFICICYSFWTNALQEVFCIPSNPSSGNSSICWRTGFYSSSWTSGFDNKNNSWSGYFSLWISWAFDCPSSVFFSTFIFDVQRKF